MAHIKISKRTTMTADYRQRLQIWISETTNNIPPKVFVYQRIPQVPLYTGLSDIFVHLASYADIADFPEDQPGADSPFFRKYYLDLMFDSLSVLDGKWEMLRLQLRHLIEDISRLNNLGPVEIEELAV